MMYLIHHLLENSADRYPDKEAVFDTKNRFSFEQIELQANSFANWLININMNKGDRIAILSANSVEYIIAYYGVLKSGCIAVPLNTGLEVLDLRLMINDCQARVLIYEKKFNRVVQSLLKESGHQPEIVVGIDLGNEVVAGSIYTSWEAIVSTFSQSRPEIDMIDLDTASIIYTSGSTGKPKGVMLTHINILSNTRSILAYLRLNRDDRCMVVLPFYYVYGKSLLNTHFAVSGSVVIDNRLVFPNSVLKNMIKEEVTGFAGVPSTFSFLLNQSSFAKMTFPHLRYITQAGGHMTAEVKRRLREILPDKSIYIMYGATEASARLAYLEPDQMKHRINSFGKAIPNVRMAVLKEDGREAQAGEEGEIVARGSNIMLGYWNAPTDTDKVLRNGWYFTGDLGCRDEAGFFYHTGRKRDMIKVGIYKISANEIEEVLYQYPGVHEAAVVGVSDDIDGEAIRAFVVPISQGTVEPDDLIRFCRESLPWYKIPKDIIFVGQLPKSEAGKILKKSLIEKTI
jgi:acyl-CoA synthetase (AMP-forming)/AMP-acid ligase II